MPESAYSFPPQDKKILSDLRRSARLLTRACLFCGEPTVKNHVFPRGYLKKITSADHIQILAEDSLFRSGYNGEGHYYFDRIGVRDIAETGFGMQVFCNKHDTQVFKLIDQMETGTLKHKHFMLCAFKSLLHEYSKNENNVIWMQKAKLRLPLAYKYLGFQKGEGWHGDLMLSLAGEAILMQSVLFENMPSFYGFKYFTINKKIEFFMNAFFGLGSNFDKISQDIKGGFFITCIPQLDKTVIIFGGEKLSLDKVFKHFFFQNKHLMGEKKVLKLVSDFAIRNVETWGMSEEFYKEFVKHKESQILNRIKEMFPLSKKIDPVGDLCIFWD